MRAEKELLLANYSKNYWIGIFGILLLGFFLPRLLAFLPAIFSIFFITAIYFKERIFIYPQREYFILFSALVGLAALSSLWSIDPAYSFEKSLKLLLVLVPGIFFLKISSVIKPAHPHHYKNCLVLLLAISSLFLIFEQSFNHIIINLFYDVDVQMSKLNRSFVVFSFLSLFTLYEILTSEDSATKKSLSFGIAFLLTLSALYLSGSQTAQLTFICGFIFLIFFPIKSIIMGKILFGLIIILCFCLPFVIEPVIESIPEQDLLEGILMEASIVHRFEVWEFTVTKIKDSLILGHGIESQRFMKSDHWMLYQNADSILHAHNVILQIWIEFGVIGIILASLYLVRIYKKIFGTVNLDQRKLFLMVFTSAFCCAMTGYGFWQGWQMGLFFIITGWAISLKNKKA